MKGFERTASEAGIALFVVKGWDYPALLSTYSEAVKICREGHVPVLIHVTEITQPQGHSTSGSHERYKSVERLDWEKQNDCLVLMRKWILDSGIGTEKDLAVPHSLLQPTEPFADYLKNAAARIDESGEAQAERDGARVGVSRPHESAHLHVAGEAAYIDDMPELAGTLHAALGLSPVAHGTLTGMALQRIRALPGVVAVLTAADIPGPNDCGSIVHDEPILADGELRYLGQPVFAVIAETRDAARRAASRVFAITANTGWPR